MRDRIGILKQFLDLADGLARNDNAGHAGAAGRRVHLRLGQAMTVGRHGAQLGGVALADDMAKDAVQIIAGLFGGDGKLRAVDQAFELRAGHGEGDRQVAGIEVRKIGVGQHLQQKASAARLQRHCRTFRGIETDFSAVRQFADNVVEHERGNRRRAGLFDHRRRSIDDLHVQIRRFQGKIGALRLEQYVAKDGDGVAALNDAMNVVQGFEKIGPFDRDFHDSSSTRRHHPECGFA